jgi:hypothetical protein
MPGRVLNFLEFSDKYSNASSEPTSIDDLTNAAANFEEGFDDTTYDQPQIGPNRPVSGNYEATPSKPGEEGSPAFSANNTEEMNAPSEGTENEEEELPEEEETEPAEGESEEESDEEEEDEDDQEEGNPEAGANPKKKKVEEGITLVKGFSQFVNESYEGYGNNPNLFDEEEYGEHEDHDHEEEDDTCEMCGEVSISNEYGYSCGCNM